ncbi:MAG TPA: hypothetical protein VF331_27205 [Polyangiales bacterium]
MHAEVVFWLQPLKQAMSPHLQALMHASCAEQLPPDTLPLLQPEPNALLASLLQCAEMQLLQVLFELGPPVVPGRLEPPELLELLELPHATAAKIAAAVMPSLHICVIDSSFRYTQRAPSQNEP